MAIDPRNALIGRDALVRRLAGMVANSATSAVLVHGASGVGKSRVAADAADLLESQSWAVLRINGTAGLAGVPLAALAPIFVGDQPDLATITSNPFALLEYSTGRVKALAKDRRTVLLVDDISLVDSLSLSVLVQLVHSKVLKLIATIREGDPLPEAILAMWTGDTAARLDVPPLDEDDTGLFIAAQVGGQVAHRTVVAMHEASGGNPLYLRELVLGAVSTGELVQRDGSWLLTAPPTASAALRELILSRLARLSPAETDVVERLALCQPLPIDELVADGARTALAGLERAGLVVIAGPNQRVTASLAHPQYVAAVRASLPRLRGSDILMQQAEVISARALAGLAPDDPVRIATWHLDAGHPSNPELLIMGARLTRLAGDFTETVRLAQAAVIAGATDPATYFLLGEALRTVGRTEEALEALDRANAAWEHQPADDEFQAGIATLHALTRADEPLGFRAGLAELEVAEERFPTHAGPIAFTRSTLLLYSERPNLAVLELERVTPQPGYPEVAFAAHAVASALPLAAVGRSAEAVAAAEAALLHAQTAGASAIISPRTGMFLSASVLISAGQPLAAVDHAMGALQDAITHDDEVSTRHAEFTLGHCYMELGRLGTSARWFRDAVSGALAHGPISFRGPALGALATILAWRGEVAEARAALAEIPQTVLDWDASATVAMAWLDALDGKQTAARDRLLERADRYDSGGYAFLETWLLFSVARLGFAGDITERLSAVAARTDSPLNQLRARHGSALATQSAVEAARIGEDWREHGHRLFAAEAFAAASRFSSKDGDQRAASQFARESARLADLCEGADTPGLRLSTGVDILTAREREMALMAASGLSSQAIASQLFLSVRTVDNHLQAVYRKLGVAGRADLAGAL